LRRPKAYEKANKAHAMDNLRRKKVTQKNSGRKQLRRTILKRAAAKTTSGILRLSFSAADIANACAFAWEEGRRKCLACLTKQLRGNKAATNVVWFCIYGGKKPPQHQS
jgi:hypothetical protein